jgi:hypothetical protein
VNKTFISKDLYRPDQDESEKEMIATLEQEIKKVVIENGVLKDDTYLVDTFKAIAGHNIL